MGLLDQLKDTKCRLKPTRTIITRPDGQQYVEVSDTVISLGRNGSGYVVDTSPDNKPAQITEHLFLGSQDCCDESVLQHHDIKNVLSVGIEAPVKCDDVTYKFIEMLDVPETDLSIYLKDCLDFIETALNSSSNVLVHCNAGVSRSASVVIAFLILKRQHSFQEAFDRVVTARRCIRPNDGFLKQLKSLKPFS
ncbi:MAP kinase-specific phosphatase [Rhynchophorus ferrugineus]|uniref:Dual specificity protein phosphatase 19 n=1 Tax=Rhynchophorus ferrugineus TaxID=354439 RepID=A0A834I6J5_RHYFE|nr:hypothetical protein GWI33_013405 [Rhynchophorus ferrugineus]